MARSLRLLVLSNGAVGHTQRWVDYFVDRGDEVHLASLERGVATRATEHRLPTLAPTQAIRYPLALPAVRRVAARVQPDLVACHFVPNYGLLGAMLGRRPLVTVAWGSDILINPRRSRFHLWRARYSLESADVVLSDAQVLTEAIFDLGIRPRRIETFTFGVDTSLFRPPAVRSPGPPVILSYRQLLPLYHVDLLIRAVPEIARRTGQPFQVRIVGQGSERPRLIELAGKLGVAERIWFAPRRLNDDELVEEIRNASIYVSTSRSDTTSVSLLEAMACGAAPVVTDIAGNREWVRDGENGYLVPLERPDALADAVVKLLESPAEREAFAERNLRTVRARGDWARNMEKTRALLQELTGGAAR